MKANKKIALIIAGFMIGGIFALFYFRSTNLTDPNYLFNKLKELTTERRCYVLYDIGTVDSGFGISKEEFAKAVKEAEKIWEYGIGKDIFTAAFSEKRSDKKVKINLVFDDRQAAMSELREKLRNISSSEDKYRIVKEEHYNINYRLNLTEKEIDYLKREYESAKTGLLNQISLYESKRKEYNREVAYWNAKGGAPEEIYNRLIRERDKLDYMFRQIEERNKKQEEARNGINERIVSYNNLVAQANTVAGIINRLGEALNKDIDGYNRLRADYEEFVTGVFKTYNGEKIINVYQFYDKRDLIIILAHEMGHSLGIYHASQKNSIMYPFVTDYQNKELSKEDIALFNQVCM